MTDYDAFRIMSRETAGRLLLAVCIFAWAIYGHAQPYVGISVGYSYAKLPESSKECDNCSTHYLDAHAMPANVFAGYQTSRWAAEIGGGTLSAYHSHNVRPPLPSDIKQDITTQQLYARGLYFLADGKPRPFVSLGAARVSMKNHEYGYNDPSLQHVEQVNYDVRTRPTFGAGVQYGALRAEITQVNHVAVSHWTLEQNVTAIWIGIREDFK